MKICFFLQRRFAYVGHALTVSLHTKYPDTQFCGYVQIRSSFDFLRTQTDISYTQLLLDEDIHASYKNEKLDWVFLKELEKEYGIPYLWPFIEVDRIIRHGQHIHEYPYNTPPYSHEEMLLLLQVTAKAILKFLEEEKPDAVVFSVVGSLSSFLLYTIAKKKNIAVQIITLTRVGTRHTLTSDYKTLTDVDALYEKISSGALNLPDERARAETFLQQFRKRPAPYAKTDSPKTRPVTRGRQFDFLKPRNLLRSLQWLVTVWNNYFTGNERYDYSTVKPWHFFIDKIKQKTRVLIGFDALYDKIDLTKKFAFFPLQVEPEISTMLYAPYYTDQLWVAKQTAKSLPIDWLLYVKEHPAMYGRRTKRFYKELKKIPNVRLIPPTIESFNITTRARLIVTITGTAGWEAAIFKKPAITFGDVFYNQLPMVRQCRVISELPQLIREHLAHWKHDETALLNYLTAIFAASAEVDLFEIWNVEGGGRLKERAHELEPLVELIAKKLTLQINQNNATKN
jgi:hypothetical protein